MATDKKIMRPYKGFQEKFVRSNVDFVIGGGAAGGGKTTSAVMSIAEAVKDGRFRGVYLRNNLGDLKSGGGILDEFRNVYGNYCNIVESGDPHVDFPSGAKIDVTHISDQNKDKVLQRFKGRQYDFIYFDEGTGFTWDCVWAVYSRNRGSASWTGKVRMTTNPKKNHWLRTFLDWYIGSDGYIIPERDGVVRYFYIDGDTVRDVVWGNSKKEVYYKCKISIDRTLSRLNKNGGKITYKELIKSFTFYEGSMSDNKVLMENNSDYVGSVAAMGGRESQANLEGNWNVDTDDQSGSPIPHDLARSVFYNDPQRNNDRWITCDLADTGTDNTLAIVWDGFHVIDMKIYGDTRPKQNADILISLAEKYDIPDNHIIYDGVRAVYINDYIPDAKAFISNHSPIGLYNRTVYNLKTECYVRVVEAIKNGQISFDEEVAKRIYTHRRLRTNIMVETEFVEECSVVRFKEMPNGKKNLLSKKEMNKELGKSRSMDLLDPIAMRFLPVLGMAYGEELERSAVVAEENRKLRTMYDDEMADVYDVSLWGA